MKRNRYGALLAGLRGALQAIGIAAVSFIVTGLIRGTL